jgi:hypothetical protein
MSDPDVQNATFSKDKNTKRLLHTESIGFDLIDYHKYVLISVLPPFSAGKGI